MKKFLCIILSALLVFNTTVVYADEHGGSSGSFDPDDPQVKYPELFDENGHVKPVKLPGQELFGHMILADPVGTAAAPILAAIDDILRNYDNSDDSISIDKGGSTIHFHERFINEFNQKIQDTVHALDGYWLIEPTYSSLDIDAFLDDVYNNASTWSSSDRKRIKSDSNKQNIADFEKSYIFAKSDTFTFKCFEIKYSGLDSENYLYYDNSTGYVRSRTGVSFLRSAGMHTYNHYGTWSFSSYYNNVSLDYMKNSEWYGSPFRIFYSKTDLENYINNGKKRTYAPKLPNADIKIPIKYINNTTNLPDFNLNLDSLIGKAEADIQASIDLALKNYLDKLAELDINPPQPSNPTPTPTPSGGFTDGTTPTPTPGLSDGSDDSGNSGEVIDLLKKILDKLTSFTDSHSKFEKTITDYLEANDKKLDQIIDAVDKLSQGKEDGKDYKCKYDYTELSDYLKDLWNESDKKFDTMIDLLEENNEYQKKLVDTLDSIKSILIKQSIMDSFKDRSKETADKAKEKFPTSVPWDIAIVINAMSAEPEEPKFNLPIKIASLNIDENIEVDLSSGEWEKLAKTCRYMLSLLFVLFMVQLSRKLFFNKGGDD